MAGPRPPSFAEGRHAGVLLPLFSCASTRGWGIGEITDLPIVARWLRSAGLDLIQMLPVNEMAFGQTSPYSALSAMAIDPLYISLEAVPEWTMLGGEGSLPPDTRARLDAVRRAPGVAYAEVRAIKDEALRTTYRKFVEMGDSAGSGRPRVEAFEKFRAESRWWLEDYALFRALHQRHEHRAWWTWDEALQRREPAALDRARAELADDIRYYEFLQWLAADQWRAAREASAPVGFFGDLPFMVGADSADVWANQEMFARDLSVGTPPDAFSATGQDWGLPAYRWENVAKTNFKWLHERARRARELFDGFRVDHVIGFYRTYVRPIPLPGDETEAAPPPAPAADPDDAEAAEAAAVAAASKAFFMPAEEHHQRALGEHIIGIFRESGAYIIAEDLGTVPDFVRESLEHLQVPGYRVLRWEREWNQPGQPFRDPGRYPARSLATTGTHDTDPLAIAWDAAPREERAAIAALAGLSDSAGADAGDREFDNDVRDAVLKLLYSSGSDLLVTPIQDLFGWRDRINTPATVGDENWTWRLPWAVDRLDDEAEARERAETLREWAASTNRSVALMRADQTD